MLKGKILFSSLILMGGLAAILGLGQLWLNLMPWVEFTKTMATIVILGTLVSFIIAVDYDLPGTKGKALLAIMAVLLVTLTALVLVQICWLAFDTALFIKLVATVGILLGLVSFIMAVSEDFGGNKALRDENYID